MYTCKLLTKILHRLQYITVVILHQFNLVDTVGILNFSAFVTYVNCLQTII